MHNFGLIRVDEALPSLSISGDTGSYTERLRSLRDVWEWYEVYISADDAPDVDIQAILYKDVIEPDEFMLVVAQVQNAFKRGLRPRRRAKLVSRTLH